MANPKSSPTPDLTRAAEVTDLARQIVGNGVRTLASQGGPDVHQVLAYDLAHSAAAVETARSLIDYGSKGNAEALITCAFVADMLQEVSTRLLGREDMWGVEKNPLAPAHAFMNHRLPIERKAEA